MTGTHGSQVITSLTGTMFAVMLYRADKCSCNGFGLSECLEDFAVVVAAHNQEGKGCGADPRSPNHL